MKQKLIRSITRNFVRFYSSRHYEWWTLRCAVSF